MEPATDLPAIAEFSRQSRTIIASLHPCHTAGVVLAPFGGSRINALEELDVDALVILDALRPGSPTGVRDEFTNEHSALRRSLQAAVSNGMMSWWDVDRAYPVAQLLGRLFLQYKVDTVALNYYRTDRPTLADFDGKVRRPHPAFTPSGEFVSSVGSKDSPLIVSLQFNLRGKPKQILYIATRMRNDTEERPAWPISLLQHLVPAGFTRMSISADFLVLFSAYPHNGAEVATQNLVELLAPGSLTMIDFPREEGYNRPIITEGYPVVAMGGRADLDPWGFTPVASVAFDAHVFGYVGPAEGDEVRIYRRLGECAATPAGTLNTAGLLQVASWDVTLTGSN